MNKNLLMAETPQVGAKAQLTEGMSIVPSSKSGRIVRLGFIEIIEDDIEKVEVNTEGMTPEELDDLRIWEIEKAADEGRLRIHEIILTEEEAQRLGFRSLDPCHRFEVPDYFKISCSLHDVPSATSEKKNWRNLRPASRPNKKNKGYTRFNNY